MYLRGCVRSYLKENKTFKEASGKQYKLNEWRMRFVHAWLFLKIKFGGMGEISRRRAHVTSVLGQ